ncbi:unnamed protein product [Adineta steineri]|uniref:F-box domain-containing protein n=1 Tax=Adineta steineri TaxID=433720 RepID=A0A819DXV6_9BILA|nr:unnamed protein product [Adineta steineri]CAF3841038.1 unnamed protein product [Adineta steineri]
MENLSNEIYYEIFDYLDGCDIYQSFSNLNHRFQQLLNSSSLLYKLKFHFETDDLFMGKHQYIKYLNRNQILSLNLSSKIHYIDKFFSSFNINSLFYQLRSISLEKVKSETLVILLKDFIHLPSLTSLNIQSYDELLDLSQIYLLIFSLSKLKYLTISSNEFKDSLELPAYSTENHHEMSSIEHLNIDHHVTFKELSTIISYLPKLYDLEFVHEIEDDSTVKLITYDELSKLTKISMTISDLNFNEMYIFLTKLPSTLKIFKFILWKIDIDYLDFEMWQDLIEEYFPQLDKFYFNYNAGCSDEDEWIFNGCMLNEFISPFWINRRLSVEISRDQNFISIKMKSYKKRWYELIALNEKFNMNRSTLLSIQYIPDEDKYLKFLFEEIEWITDFATIYHLEITQPFFIGILNKIFDILPYLDSLKISSIILPTVTLLDDDELDQFENIAIYNSITKVCLEKMNTFDDVHFLLDLFPRLNYLQIGFQSDIDIQLFFQVIFMKIINKDDYNIRSLAITIPTADDQMVNEIQDLIQIKNLLFNYKITRTNDTIFLQIE